jgi:hypothetical protein
MSYKKHFKNTTGAVSPISGANSNQGAWNNSDDGNWNNSDVSYKNYMSRLPEVYTGHPNRLERYSQYEMMDIDAEINACLDIISEFSTQRNEHSGTPFDIDFNEQPTPHELEMIKTQLYQWCKLNQFDNRMFKIFRNTLKYGDQVFVRDPENFKLCWVDMTKVIKVIVNESEGKKPEQYVIKDININLQNLTVAQKTNTDFAANPATGLGGSGGGGSGGGYTVPAMPYNTSGSRFTLGQSESAIDATHIVHLSLTEGLDRFWPFGQSILENIFKVYKQKELLEDAILIYRVQRAPERRVFKIDTGNMPSHMAMAFVERVKNEIHQRRIPSPHGGSSVVDATYNPLSITEDYFFPQGQDGRGSSVEVLPGGCLAMDTKVSLLDGRELTIAEISDEMATGKELWTYSCEPVTGKVVPGLISWAGMTQESASVLKIVLDNGEHIICTPDHKFPEYGTGFKRADEFKPGDSLIPLYRKKEKISDISNNDYEQYYDNESKQWMYTHRMVANTIGEDTPTYTVLDTITKNIEIVSIEVLSKPIPVGTLTIDGNEDYHDYHTFALGCGVFTKNSGLGEIDDLRYFNNRLARGLRVPSSYLPTGPDDNTTPLSDGRVGTAMIQEFRFNQYCERLQSYLALILDQEFKLFLKWRGFNIDSGLFTLRFNPPQNFAAYRQSELDSARVSTFTTMEAIPYISKRFALERFLGLSEEEIAKNEKLWEEENKEEVTTEPTGSDLRSVGVGGGDFQADMDMADEIDAGEEAGGEPGMDVAGPVGGPEAGGAPAGGILPPP